MKLQAFSKTYDGVQVLNFPGLELRSGTIYSVIGSNGSGKSTFAKILAGVLPADRNGRYLDDGVSVGYMPQKNYAFRMSTRANILLNGKDALRAQILIETLQLSELTDKRADRLSGGETARMALARLMMQRYDLVILDEPTAAMDMETTILAENLIREYVKQTDCALIMVTHSLQQARRLADEALYFHKGILVEYGSCNRMLDSPQTRELQKFLEFYGI